MPDAITRTHDVGAVREPPEIDKILAGPDYFFCDTYRCRLTKAICIKRQTHKVSMKRGPEEGKPDYPCTGCAQGAEIAREHGIAVPKKKSPEPCKVCGEPRIYRELCPACYRAWRTGKLDDVLGPYAMVREPARHTLNRFYSGGTWE